MAKIFDPIDLIEKDIFELLDLKDLPQEYKDKMVSEMEDMLENRVIARLMDSLSKEDAEKFDNLPENDNNAITEFFKDKDINIEQITAEEALILKSDMASLINVANKGVSENA
ncbi:hypothetical protein AUK11_04175 [bacterium CG2_30_37_16]|nr:MAG: hypothetical protein AUK11_04175 [bacterium CG2_30_37_16]PIP30530.1 MAG: hypothetical protein COX25_04230 [bacterium (Candidatus Howlettbacteria) CG23_combo_of_CG06-09_8_20_14_all_37_9]PIX98690.1 MAG: hypothetical protein COZ22_04390 [bacterium (Candidatus Howlettbacteria) CG_4_10_14_3_um_filter_37_10]PJB06274.1 MAG: hypothetical protein CO123_02445 [bacterium (Candidatus Howlettbacteria) CG_4_9_14_3_um_filter_37_10]